MSKRLFSLYVAIFVLAVALAGCVAPAAAPAEESAATSGTSAESSAATSEEDRFGGTLRLAYQTDIQRPNYLITQDGPSGLLRDFTWEKLWGTAADGTTIPRLATGFEVSDNGLAYTVTLREGVTWHDGVPFTADDVVFFWDYYRQILDAGGAVDASPLDPFEVEKVDDYTVRFTLESPNPFFTYTYGQYQVLPKHIWENIDPATWDEVSDLAIIGVGVGPYRLVERSVGEFFRLERYDGYWDGRPYIDEVVLQVITDTDARNAAFESGQLDFLGNLSKATYEALGSDPSVDLTLLPSGNMTLLLLNKKDPRIQDIAVRKALSFITDRQALQVTFPNVASPMQSAVTSADLFFDPASVDPEAFEYSLEKANAVLDEAGWLPGADGVREKDSQRLEFEVLTWRPDGEPILVILGAAAEKAGIKFTLRTIDTALFVERVFTEGTEDYSIAYNGMTMGPVPSGYRAMYSAGTYTTYVNEDLQQVFLDLYAATSPDEQKALFGEVQSTVTADRAAVWLLEGTRVIGARNGLNLDDAGVSGLYQQFTNISKAYFEN